VVPLAAAAAGPAAYSAAAAVTSASAAASAATSDASAAASADAASASSTAAAAAAAASAAADARVGAPVLALSGGPSSRGLHSFQFQLNLNSSVHRVTRLKLSVGLTCQAYLLEIDGLLTQGSRPGRTVGGSVGGFSGIHCSDWSNGIQYQIFDNRPDTEFNS